MNYEIIIIIVSSYLLGIITMWIREKCTLKEENTPVCHFHPANQMTRADTNEPSPYDRTKLIKG